MTDAANDSAGGDPHAVASATVVNLRDLGGTPLPGGARMRPGLVFRSGSLHRLDIAQDRSFRQLGITTVVDLRTSAERSARPDRLPDGARLVVADVMAGAVGDAAHAVPTRLESVLSDPDESVRLLGGGRAQELFAQTYRGFVTSDSARKAYGSLLTELADPDGGPLLFHCTAGKDRTGWGAVVILMLLGAEPQEIEREYLAVNPAVRAAFAPFTDAFIGAGGDPEIADAVTGVRPAYLSAALGAMARRWGAVDVYVREGLGVPDETVERIRERLIA